MVRKLAAVVLVAFTVLPPGAARAAATTVTIDNLAFSPAAKTVSMGSSVEWQNDDDVTHTSTRAAIVGWDSGPIEPTMGWCCRQFRYAGSYPYVCNIHDFMSATIKVPVIRSPLSGSTSTTFTITVATVTAPAGYVYDVQKRKDGVSYSNWRMGISGKSVSFLAGSSGPGTYSFRARIRRVVNGPDPVSGYSAGRSVTVS